MHLVGFIIRRIHNLTIRIHNLQKLTEAYKTYNHICNDTKQYQKNIIIPIGFGIYAVWKEAV